MSNSCRQSDGRCAVCGGDWSVCGCQGVINRSTGAAPTPPVDAVLGDPVAWCDPHDLSEGVEDFMVGQKHGFPYRYTVPLYAAPVASRAGMEPVLGPRGGALKRFDEWFDGEDFARMSAREIASLGFDAGHTFWHETAGLSCAAPTASAATAEPSELRDALKALRRSHGVDGHSLTVAQLLIIDEALATTASPEGAEGAGS